MRLLPKIALVLPLLWTHARAHELQDNRATLVLRDGTHLSVTLYIGYADALHLALAPQRSVEEFLIAYSGMNPEQLQRELGRVQARFQAATRLYLVNGKEVALTNWVWPDARQVQALLQQRIMRAVVDPTSHAHEEPLEIHAEARAPEEIHSVRVQFPDEFQKVLVVSYRPNQVWVERKSLSGPIKFE